MDRVTMWRLSLCLLLQCHCVYSQLSGWVESPGYPYRYLPFTSLNWNRCAPEGYILSLTLTHLDLEDSQDCENDALEIFSDTNLISILCGQRTYAELQSIVNPSLISLPGGCLSLSFHSDYSNVRRHSGFRSFYTVQDIDECKEDAGNGCTQFCHNFIGGYHCSCRFGYQLDTDGHTCTVNCNEDLSGLKEGVIYSPSWPGLYTENSKCLYTLSTEDHLQLELHFSTDFDVEQSADGGCIDSLMVETDSRTLGPFCGQTSPSLILTHSHQVRIHFTSDSFGTNRGFSITYRTRAKTCPDVMTPRSSMDPQKSEFSSGDVVKVTCDLGYVPDKLYGIENSYLSTCQMSGVWSPVYKCEPVYCSLPNIAEDGVLRLKGGVDTRKQFNDEIWFQCISEYYTLDRNESYVCNANGFWISTSGQTVLPRCVEVCGKTSEDIVNTGRILGGTIAKLGEIPWQLFIKAPKRGGASLINDRWAVTAAHVVEDVEEAALQIYGGLVDGRKVVRNPSEVTVMDVHKIIIHPMYKVPTAAVRTDYDNDIALIRMASRVKLGPNLSPICLPEADGGLREDQIGSISGWGATDKADISAMLRYANIAGYSRRRCQDTPLFKGRPIVFTDNMFCAGAQGKDSCSRDSGGPFVLPMLGKGNKEGMGPYRLKGLVSWGSSCDLRQFKGYYTKVENYVDWIQETMARVEEEERG